MLGPDAAPAEATPPRTPADVAEDHTSLPGRVVDSLEEQVAVISHTGRIIFVNRSWERFSSSNGGPVEFDWVGTDYLAPCDAAAAEGDDLAADAMRGIRRVIAGRAERFIQEYPCHCEDAQRWFLMRVTRLDGRDDDRLVITHHDITQRKLAEERVEALSRHDALTELPNRRHFDRFLRDEWLRSMRHGHCLSVLMIDIDHFKAFNDALGHLAGDTCLRMVGGTLRAYARRASDLAARFGGEEFALVLGETDLYHALDTAEGIRLAIQNMDIRYDDARRVTVSLGVATMVPIRGQSEMRLLERADRALYVAKQAGRNGVATLPDEVDVQTAIGP